jgi:hypothetical protein
MTRAGGAGVAVEPGEDDCERTAGGNRLKMRAVAITSQRGLRIKSERPFRQFTTDIGRPAGRHVTEFCAGTLL